MEDYIQNYRKMMEKSFDFNNINKLQEMDGIIQSLVNNFLFKL